MKVLQSAVLSSVASDDAISTEVAGFLPGMQVPAFLTSPSADFAGSAIIQTSEDGSTWGTATGAVAKTTDGTEIQVITLKQYVRLNVTARSAGSVQMTLLSNVG
jgi:hypothetical protein